MRLGAPASLSSIARAVKCDDMRLVKQLIVRVCEAEGLLPLEYPKDVSAHFSLALL